HMVQALEITTVMPGAHNLTLIHDMVLESLDMYFESNTGILGCYIHLRTLAIYSGSTFKSKFSSPFKFPFTISQVQLDLTMLSNSTPLAELHTPFNPAITSGDEILSSFDKVPTIVLDEDL